MQLDFGVARLARIGKLDDVHALGAVTNVAPA
jgi:hypothetical protein